MKFKYFAVTLSLFLTHLVPAEAKVNDEDEYSRNYGNVKVLVSTCNSMSSYETKWLCLDRGLDIIYWKYPSDYTFRLIRVGCGTPEDPENRYRCIFHAADLFLKKKGFIHIASDMCNAIPDKKINDECFSAVGSDVTNVNHDPNAPARYRADEEKQNGSKEKSVVTDGTASQNSGTESKAAEAK